MLVSGFGVLADDMVNTNPPPAEPPPVPPAVSTSADVPPPPPPQPTTVAYAPATTTVNTTTTTTTQPVYYRAATDTDHRLGVGLILGEPIGASVKYWLNEQMAVDGALGFSTHNHSPFYVHADLLWHKFDLIEVSEGKLPVYFGVGGLLRFRDGGRSNDAGIRVPVGVDYLFDNLPVDVFAEIGPALDVAPDVHGEITGGIGVRFWF